MRRTMTKLARDMFCSVIDLAGANRSTDWREVLDDESLSMELWGEALESWKTMSTEARAKWLIGQLWNCGDVMPRDVCDDLDLPLGCSYAKAVRKLRQETAAD